MLQAIIPGNKGNLLVAAPSLKAARAAKGGSSYDAEGPLRQSRLFMIFPGVPSASPVRGSARCLTFAELSGQPRGLDRPRIREWAAEFPCLVLHGLPGALQHHRGPSGSNALVHQST